MPTIYENHGHRRSSMRNYHRLVYRLAAWREDPHCRNPKCRRLTHNMPFSEDWQNKATLDHIIARGLGGSDTEENFTLLCGNCNQTKSDLEGKLLGVIQRLHEVKVKS